MRFRLQLFPPKILRWVVLLVLFLLAALTAYVLRNKAWFVLVPLGIAALVLFIAVLPLRRKVTPGQLADELERHLLGTGGAWDWDDTTSVAIADDRLERLRWVLPKFDPLTSQEGKEELRAIIEALRRGEVPDISPPTNRRHTGG